MAIKSVQAIVNGVTTTLTYDSASKTYKATLTAPAKSSYNQSGHYYGVQIIAKDEAGNTTTVNQSDATLGSKLRLTVKEKTAPVITISSPTASQLLTSNQPTISFTVTDDDSGVNPDTIKLLIDGSEISGITKTKTTSGYSCSYKPSTALSDGSHTVVVKASDYDGNAATQKSVSFKIDTVPPELSVTSPVNKLVTNKTKVTVAGTTNDATSSPVTLTINGSAVTVYDDGTFSKDITLKDGSNTITVVAKDGAGRTTTVTRTVTLDTKAPVISDVSLASKGKNVKLRKEIAIAIKECMMHEGIFGVLVSHGSSTVPKYIVDEINALGGNIQNAYGISIEELKGVAFVGNYVGSYVNISDKEIPDKLPLAYVGNYTKG